MSFDGRGYYNTKCAAAAAPESSEKVCVLACVCCDQLARCKDNSVLENLVGGQAKVMARGTVTTTLDVASDSADGLKL